MTEVPQYNCYVPDFSQNIAVRVAILSACLLGETQHYYLCPIQACNFNPYKFSEVVNLLILFDSDSLNVFYIFSLGAVYFVISCIFSVLILQCATDCLLPTII